MFMLCVFVVSFTQRIFQPCDCFHCQLSSESTVTSTSVLSFNLQINSQKTNVQEKTHQPRLERSCVKKAIHSNKSVPFTISWATSSETSLLRSKENSMASLSLYFPLSFFISSILSHNLIASISPSSSSASSTRTPVSSWKNAWFRRSLMEYLKEWEKIVSKWFSWRSKYPELIKCVVLKFKTSHSCSVVYIPRWSPSLQEWPPCQNCLASPPKENTEP